jgi:hypothetical protein
MIVESVKYLATAWMAKVLLPAEKWKMPVFKNTCLTSNRYQGLVLRVKMAGVLN